MILFPAGYLVLTPFTDDKIPLSTRTCSVREMVSWRWIASVARFATKRNSSVSCGTKGERVKGEDLVALEQQDLGFLPLRLEGLVAFARGEMRFALRDHLGDLLGREPGGRRHGDRLLEAGLEILRADAHDAVGVDLERHLDLDLALRRAAQARSG